MYTDTRQPARWLPLQLIMYVHKILIRNGNGVTYRIGYKKMKMKGRKVGRCGAGARVVHAGTCVYFLGVCVYMLFSPVKVRTPKHHKNASVC